MNKIKFVVILMCAVVLSQCKSDAIYNIKYTDQNNNHYLITQDTFLYDPITAMESSSGVYDGGDPVNKEIPKATFNEVAALVKAMIDDKNLHSEKRLKGTSIIVVTQGNLNDKYFIKSNPIRDQLETLLEEIKKP